MAELTTRQKRNGLEIAETVATLASKSNDAFIKKELYRSANMIRKHFGFTDAEKESEILRRIKLGAATVNDLIRETGFPQQTIDAITKQLEQAKLISSQRLKMGKMGRPGQFFFPNDENSGMLYSN